ncbi:MAG TPA: (2Fe-2S)-binding protein [Gaiellaceae bacterium]|nr:(2Fe-2S)-binding protein [Gaiellaceae bacterium]
MSDHTIELVVNGTPRRVTLDARRTLADLLRDDLGLTGTHLGCEHGVCGACTVLLDGATARSCITLAVQADGAEVTTVEGVADRGGLHPLQEAFSDAHSFQCGFCTPGFVLEALAFLRETPSPSEQEVREALAGNVCRCTGYESIVRGVLLAATRAEGAS